MLMEKAMTATPLIIPHGGYKKLISYRLGNLIYDATRAFCDRYIDRRDRTFDQMLQAARSGVSNIIEGSEAGAASKKTEIKLTNVAKASQEELLADYRAFLRQRGLPEWPADSQEAQLIRRSHAVSLTELRKLMATLVSDKSDILATVAANTMICLINQETYLLRRQIERLAADFKNNGGFSERLYRVRKAARDQTAK